MTKSVRTLAVVAAAAAIAGVLGVATAAAETPVPAPVAPVAASPLDAALHAVVTAIPGMRNTGSAHDICALFQPPVQWSGVIGLSPLPPDPCANFS